MNNCKKEIIFSKNKALYLNNNFDIFLKQIKKRVAIFNFLKNKYYFQGEILEIGAGSCWFSALVSKFPNVKTIYALDISKDLFDKVGKNIIAELQGNDKKINFIISDFHKMPFSDKKFDIIICDASLHHSYNISILLKEIKRVLKDEGSVIAIREPVKSILHNLKLKKFGTKEIKKGSIENIYSKKKWMEHFKKSGFKLYIYEEYSQNDIKTKIVSIPIIKLFNGIFFSRCFFYAKKIK